MASELEIAAFGLLMNIQEQLEQQPYWNQYEFFSPQIDLYHFYRLGRALHIDSQAVFDSLQEQWKESTGGKEP